MALNDIYQITHDMTLFGKTVISTYHVERSSGVEVAGSISDAFQNSILLALRLLQSDEVVNNELRIFNLGETTDFGTFTLGASVGLRLGLDSPRFISGAIRFPTRDRDVRNGFKRLPGMLESDYTDGVISAATLVLMDDIGDVLIADWLSSIDAHVVCNYVVLARVCETFDPVTGKCIEYRLPDSDVELKFFTPNQRISQVDITSQVSRKLR